MKIIVGNDLKIIDPSYNVLQYCEAKLTLANPDFIIASKLGRYVGKMDKSIKLYVKDGNSLILPYGCLNDIWRICKGSEFEIKHHAKIGNNLVGNIKLYDYQEKALNSLKIGKNGVLEAPCGSGKTNIGLQLIKEIGGKALWLTHTKKLLEQSLDRAKANYKGDFGTITEGKVNIGKDITFATVQTMRNIDPSIYKDSFDIVVVDECHHAVGTPTKVQMFYKVITNINARYKYGLSATLNRADNLTTCVYSIIGSKLYTITEKEVGSKIIKAKHERINVDIKYNIADYSEGDGTLDYNALINMLSENVERNNAIINNVKAIGQNGVNKQLVLCHRVKQVEYINDQLLKEGIKSKAILGKIKDKDRDYTTDVIVATYSLAKEGLDIPELNVLHLATPQKDRTTTKQSAGRIERNIEGKKQPIIYDYVDTDIPYCLVCYRKRLNILK